MIQKLKTILRITPVRITFFVIPVALVLFLSDFQFFRLMELKTLDLRMASRGPLVPGNETAIAAIDEKSISELGRWPWPRSTIARLVDLLKKGGAKAIGFDIVFSEPDDRADLKTIDALTAEMKKSGVTDSNVLNLLQRQRASAGEDGILAASIQKAGNITLGYFFHFSQQENEKELAHITQYRMEDHAARIVNSRYSAVNSLSGTSNDGYLPRAFAPETNISILAAAAQNSGFFNTLPDSDGSNRWAPLVVALGENYYSSLAVSMVCSYLDFPVLSLNLESYGANSIGIGEKTIPTNESGQLLINYLGPPRTFPHYSVADILSGTIPPDTFRDKIVLVGATAVGIYDLRVTPFSSTFPGVEIHATVIDNILHENFLTHSSFIRMIDVGAIILFGLIMGLLVSRLRPISGMASALLIIAVFIAMNFLAFFRFNVWLNLVYPLTTMMMIYLGITIYHYFKEEQEKKKIRSAFQYYLTSSVINEMLKNPGKLKLGGDRRNLTVLFSDIRGFTTISEKMTPEELIMLLNEYLTAMTNQVFYYDGLLDKYMGDAIMAVFGAPLDQPDHARRACLTALAMMRELRRLQNKWEAEGRPVFDIGIGINSGEMVVGNMGSAMRFDYTVMGDMVNLGSRLEGANKEYGTNIIISEFTYNHVKDTICCREIDSVRVKGKTRPVRIFELLGEKKDEPGYQNLIKVFATGLTLYRDGKWDDAIAAFQDACKIKHDDFVSTTYIERCKTLKQHPPAHPWNGVFVMTKK
ncbi:MAG TPA: adenylate/guanylate cyclase domain-containing protein [Smithellaceae bacterium]|jgi:adenylate cyclase|nr:adenylate/guanylate cyclase domain-containing protein [Smithella sp.]HNZ10979.1 adenylate/guanylate cyclase domain-containing protein [Smithellaceae bacterium]HOG81770.1 adenylate/guanylate cyclase domain-containing protein [Smithellaceae bacterium]HQP25531.1 adenylate/guanylate cyclase domain-containing protein [Smithellaceae bacterium]